MSPHSELLAAFDAVYDRPWESILAALDGVTEDEAAYQHPAYFDEPRQEGYPPPGTILWHIVHLAACYQDYNAAIQSRPNPPSELPSPQPAALQEALENLKRTRDALRSTLANLEEKQLDDLLHWGNRVVDLARGTVRHDAWHSGQIAVARRLYRMRERS